MKTSVNIIKNTKNQILDDYSYEQMRDKMIELTKRSGWSFAHNASLIVMIIDDAIYMVNYERLKHAVSSRFRCLDFFYITVDSFVAGKLCVHYGCTGLLEILARSNVTIYGVS